ncbi:MULTISPECIES: HAMP domain-containing sensor histidine kinase [unclassified Paenibacillus]|uniref:sensor histidine kinase n=1 Tax=unclassified Paenibacillus TaxID=185978 RepID=UPI00020D7A0C|nr:MULTISPECIES: HAMP domain-containing sensor histidine kinase [unclassified Paenibacillus]EGL19220.1 ATPase/histidine kinase/DNA gyrase B/HSP90 domain protein [Paenibacillus sp. HGF7]EPD81201.1 hypothetical protein HMPREF1207_04958 [Paenibacillus sp. HGH0039]
MSIRFKLLLSYAAMLVIPLVMMLITAMLLVVVFRGDLQSIKDQYGEGESRFENRGIERLLKEIKRTTEINPAAWTDASYLAEIDGELQRNQSNLILRKGDEIVYAAAAFPYPELLKKLPAYERPGNVVMAKPERIGKQLVEVVHADFKFEDGQKGSLFVVTAVSPFVTFARKFFPILFIALIVILILTHTLLTYFVSRSIIKPLNTLKAAMKRIEAGDLDSRVVPSGRDEIGELSAAFEQMRMKLKASIQTQLQYEENRKELISNISHDIRTPLTAIRGYVEGLGDGIADTDEKREKYIGIITSKAEEMDHLIDELFLYSKLDLKRLPFNFEAVDLHAFIEDLSSELEFELGKQGIRYSADIRLKPHTELAIDRDKIKRVFVNIVDNSVKYMNKPDKQIGLKVLGTGQEVRIEISDNGRGIDAESIPYIFERFYRADPSRNSDTGGSGLGLAISKQIIDGHGGTIRASSLPDEGSCVTIMLPIRTNKESDSV